MTAPLKPPIIKGRVWLTLCESSSVGDELDERAQSYLAKKSQRGSAPRTPRAVRDAGLRCHASHAQAVLDMLRPHHAHKKGKEVKPNQVRLDATRRPRFLLVSFLIVVGFIGSLRV